MLDFDWRIHHVSVRRLSNPVQGGGQDERRHQDLLFTRAKDCVRSLPLFLMLSMLSSTNLKGASEWTSLTHSPQNSDCFQHGSGVRAFSIRAGGLRQFSSSLPYANADVGKRGTTNGRGLVAGPRVASEGCFLVVVWISSTGLAGTEFPRTLRSRTVMIIT